MERDTTTIALHRSTVQRLGELGKFNESYEDVVNRLLDSTGVKRAGSDS